MSDGAPLVASLRRIRRRMRFWMALEGAVTGAAIGLGALAVALAVTHQAGRSAGWGQTIGLAAAVALGGAAVRALRRIPLEACARFADAALDGQDRILSAVCLAGETSPLARALLADAVARLAGLAPQRAVPARRPRAIPALGAGAIAVVLAGLVPVRSRAAIPRASTASPTRHAPVAAATLEAEWEVARAATEAARKLGDERLAALAADLEHTLRRLESGTLGEGDALDALASIEGKAGEAARAAERDSRALEAAERALTADAATRAAGKAIGAGDAADAERARAALGAQAEAHPAETGRALAAAASAVNGAQGEGAERSPDKPGQRRLARDGDRDRKAAGANDGAQAGEQEQERRLERLARDLDDAAAACRDGAPGCRAEADKSARELSDLARRAAGAGSLRRLEQATRQMRARVGRGELAQGERAGEGKATDERRFQRAARGEAQGDAEGEAAAQAEAEVQASSGKPGGDGRGQPGGDGRGQQGNRGPGQQGASGEAGEGEESVRAGTLTEREGGEGRANAEGGEGVGTEPGGPPLGRRDSSTNGGHATEARVADGAGPNRAEVIGVAAGRGFAGRSYARVFADYQAAVEDALGATAVPEGKRYIVRRYFDLIRPRSGSRRP